MQNAGALAVAVNQAKEAAVRDALEQAQGSPTKAAVLLGVSRAQVYRYMQDFGIEVERRIKPAA